MVYNDLSQLAAAFSVSSSKWNQGTPVEEAVVRVKETLDVDEAPEDVHEVCRVVPCNCWHTQRHSPAYAHTDGLAMCELYQGH